MVNGERTWTGPIHGRLGVLADDGNCAQCHICGGYYGNLGGHVTQVHGVTPSDYKALFGLNATTGLIGPALKGIRRQEADVRKQTPAFAEFRAAGDRARSELTPEQRSPKGRRLRLQQRLSPKVQAARRAALARANEVLRQRKEAGLHTPAGWSGRDPKAISAKGHARLAELRTDPAWRDAFARKVSEARGGRLQVTCVVCGVVFTEPHSHRRRKTCSPACLTMLRASRAAGRQAAAAPDRDQRRTAGIGLGDVRRQRGWSIERLARQSGLSPAHVSRIERGLNTPSFAALGRLADALGGGPFPARETTASDQSVNGVQAQPSGDSVAA